MAGINKNKKRKNNRNKKNKPKNNTVESTQPDEETVEAPQDDDDDVEDSATRKRELSDDDSEKEDAPKRKKKKKQPAPTQSTDNKKGKKSIRQMKREKYAERKAEAEASVKDQLKSQCLAYISQWKHDKQNWKFMKAKQVWLNKNKFSESLVPKESWPVLLEYFESSRGNIRTTLLEDANKVIKQMDEWTEKNGKAESAPDEDEAVSSKPDETAYKRARDLIQCLQE